MDFQLSQTRQRYRSVFSAVQQTLLAALEAVRPLDANCLQCQAQAEGEMTSFHHPLFLGEHPGCGWQSWRQAAIETIEQTIGPQLMATIQQYQGERNQITCQNTGTCCRLASSPYDWPTLQKKAVQGDAFAGQFTRVFLPYGSTEAAARAYPAEVARVLSYGQDSLSEAGGEEAIYFYYCPHLQPDHRCGLYGAPERPALCGSYPETPLTYVTKQCAWHPWQAKWHDLALTLHASITLCDYALERLKSP